MPAPHRVHQTKFPVDRVLYDDGDFAVAWGSYEDEREKRLGMRWNGGRESDFRLSRQEYGLVYVPTLAQGRTAMRPKRTWRLIYFSFKSAIVFLILASASLVEAQTLQTLCSFNGSNGRNPYAALTLGSDGNFYGTTYSGGSSSSSAGTLFKVTTNGTLTTLVSFDGSNGANPYAALTLGSDGNFYGTTYSGGGYGTVFKVTTNGTLTTLVSFNGSNGDNPYAALTLGSDGNFCLLRHVLVVFH
jgi:uncharacterized repeat protein (TIGR03803 family)